jgi:hypothetical protein
MTRKAGVGDTDVVAQQKSVFEKLAMSCLIFGSAADDL